MLTDFDNLQSGTTVTLYPNNSNPLHSKPVQAYYDGGYFYCVGSDLSDGPDYYLGDVALYNKGYSLDA